MTRKKYEPPRTLRTPTKERKVYRERVQEHRSSGTEGAADDENGPFTSSSELGAGRIIF